MKRPMRILHVSPFYAPAWCYGGLVEAVHQFTCHLARAGAEVRILTTDANGPAKRLDRAATAPYAHGQPFEVRYCARAARQSVSPELARALIEEVRWADAVHLHAAYSFPTIPTMLAARLMRRPLVWTPHGALQRWQGTRRTRLKSVWEAVCRTAAPRRMVVHMTSRAECDEARDRFPGATTALIANGVEVPEGLCRTPRGEELRLGFLGRLDPIKGIENLLTACRILKDRGAVKFKLEIAGSGVAAYEQIVREEIARLGLGQDVTMAGELRGRDKQRMLERSDLVVVPSFTENFGIVVAEALAHGAAVIASTGTPWSELERRRCGLWVDNRPATIADAIAVASSMPLDEMGERGRRWMAERYSWDRCAAEMMELYKSIAAQPERALAAAT